MKKLIEQITFFVPEARIELSDLEPFFSEKSLEKEEILLPLGRVCHHYYFIKKGVVKISYIVDDEWITSWVAFENYFFTELESYASDTASQMLLGG